MKRLAAIGSFVLFVLVLSKPALAQQSAPGESGMAKPSAPTDAMILPYPGPEPTQLLGQQQYYSVTFRGNGEAVIAVRVTLSNLEDTPISGVLLRIPKAIPQDIIAFQVVKEPRCVRYGSGAVQYETSPEGIRVPVSRCVQYQEPDYYQIWDGSQAKYQKAATQLQTDTIVVTLPKPIATNKSGSFLLYYRAVGFAKKDLVGGYHFAFETAKVEDKIQTLQVGINTDSDLLLKGTKGQVNYRFEDVSVAMKEASGMSAPVASPQVDQFYQQIGYGQIVKTANNLQPLDSYTVKGSYADATWKLYAKEVGIAILVLLVLVIGGALIARAVAKNLGKGGAKAVNGDNKATAGLLVFGTSFASSFVALLYTIVLLFVTRSLTSFLPYETTTLVTLLLLLISCAIYGFLLFAPAAFFGLKRGIGWGLATAGLTVGWLMVYLVILIIFLALGLLPSRGGPIPMMDRVFPAMGVQSIESAPPRALDTQMIEE